MAFIVGLIPVKIRKWVNIDSAWKSHFLFYTSTLISLFRCRRYHHPYRDYTIEKILIFFEFARNDLVSILLFTLETKTA